ncbi:MAG: hypothetical protein C4308_13080 [Chitinophagaceae bacterium]
MKLFIAFCLLGFSFIGKQTDSWKVYHNKELLLSTSEENEQKNIIAISKTAAASGEWMVTYFETFPNPKWKRYFSIVTGNDKIVFEKGGVSKIRLSGKALKKFFGSANSLKVYTWSLPTDPEQAALVRVRRVHLTTLTLK